MMSGAESAGQIRRYFRLDRRDLVYLKFILEAYEGMSTLTTVDKSGVLVRLTIPAEFEKDLQELIAALYRDIELCEVAEPEPSPEGVGHHAG